MQSHNYTQDQKVTTKFNTSLWGDMPIRDMFSYQPCQVTCINPNYAGYELEMGTTDVQPGDFHHELGQLRNPNTQIRPRPAPQRREAPRDAQDILPSFPNALEAKQSRVEATGSLLHPFKDGSHTQSQPQLKPQFRTPIGSASKGSTTRATTRLNLTGTAGVSEAARELFDKVDSFGSTQLAKQNDIFAPATTTSSATSPSTNRLPLRPSLKVSPSDPKPAGVSSMSLGSSPPAQAQAASSVSLTKRLTMSMKPPPSQPSSNHGTGNKASSVSISALHSTSSQPQPPNRPMKSQTPTVVANPSTTKPKSKQTTEIDLLDEILFSAVKR